MVKNLSAQIYRVSYGDEKYMDCTSKSLYTHCCAKRDLPDGKWVFMYPGTETLAMVVYISNKNWNGIEYRYREDGSLSSINTYKNGKLDGDNRAYYPNEQMHFKGYYVNGEPVGDFFAFDSLGNVTRHDTRPINSVVAYRKEFVPINITDIFKADGLNKDFDMIFSGDSIEWIKQVAINGTSIYSIQAKSPKSHVNNRKVFIGQHRDSLLNNIGTDYYILTEQYVDYVTNSQNQTLYQLNDIPAYLLRCYFNNDVISQIIIVNNQTKTYCQIVRLLKVFFNEYHVR